MEPTETLTHFQTKTAEGLSRCIDDAGIFRFLNDLYLDLDRFLAQIVEAEHISLACKSGCSFCCYLKVDAKAHEILYLAHHVRRTLDPALLKTVSKRAASRLAELERMTAHDSLTANRACPLLENGKCSVYGARPVFCRTFHAQRVETCQFSFDNPHDLKAGGSQNYLLTLHAAHAAMGISRAFAEQGYDKSVYDLGAALSEALGNPKASKRWRNKIKAFSRRSFARDYSE